jgi:phage nucleotide-binding protein
MKIYSTGDSQIKPSLVMLVYGEGGVGKTTFASTAPKPLLLDFENGAKYFGLRGIKTDVAQISSWGDVRDPELIGVIKSDKYDTVVIDPIGEAMEKLKQYMITLADGKLVQKDGSPTMAGWGWLKKTMRDYVKFLRDSGKHVLFVAHINESKDEERLIKRPKIETKISAEIVNMVDVVGYMTVFSQNGEEKRVIIVDPSSDKYTAKDRTGQLGKIIEPDFQKIIHACQGTKKFAWSKGAEAEAPKEETPKVSKAEGVKAKLAKANGK